MRRDLFIVFVRYAIGENNRDAPSLLGGPHEQQEATPG